MAEELVQKIRAAIMPEDIREKCLELVEKCKDEKLLKELNKLILDYFEKRNKEIAESLKKDRSLTAKMQKKLAEFEKTGSDTDAENFLKSTKWE